MRRPGTPPWRCRCCGAWGGRGSSGRSVLWDVGGLAGGGRLPASCPHSHGGLWTWALGQGRPLLTSEARRPHVAPSARPPSLPVPQGLGTYFPWETPSTLVTAKGMFVTLVFQGKTGAVRLPGDRQLGVGSPSQPRRGPREPSSADTSPRRLRAPPARPASHGLPPAGPGVCSFGRPLPHLSSMRMRCPPEPTKCRDWKHKQEIEEGPPQARAEQASSLPGGPRPGGAVCVLCPRGEGQQGAGHVPPRTADLPGALVTACASICPPRGQASCIIQAPWRGPRERALTRADWPDRVS